MYQLIAEVSKTTAATLMLLASSPSRVTGLKAAPAAGRASVSWTPSPEKDVSGYVVTWGPADSPAQHTLRVMQPTATIPAAPAGTIVRVQGDQRQGPRRLGLGAHHRGVRD